MKDGLEDVLPKKKKEKKRNRPNRCELPTWIKKEFDFTDFTSVRIRHKRT